MAVVEKIMQMRGQGMSEPQITKSLREEGLSPKEINESLSQSQIKSALNANPEDQPPATPQQIQNPQAPQMQPSIMPQSTVTQPEFQQTMQPSAVQQPYPEQLPQEAPTEYPTFQDQQPQTQQDYQEQPPPEAYPPEQAYDYYPEYQSADVETIGDIAEQMIEEKTQDLKKKVSALTKFKEDAELELEKLNKKVEKLDLEFNTLQIAILKKVGDYGDDIKNISKEMRATQDSFSKMINPIVDNVRKEEPPEEKEKKATKARKKTRKSKADFEHYLR